MKPYIFIHIFFYFNLKYSAAKPSIEYAPKNEAKIIQALWGPLNRNIITANEDGKIIIYDIRVLIYLIILSAIDFFFKCI